MSLKSKATNFQNTSEEMKTDAKEINENVLERNCTEGHHSKTSKAKQIISIDLLLLLKKWYKVFSAARENLISLFDFGYKEFSLSFLLACHKQCFEIAFSL